MKKAADIEQALSDGDYAAALALDPKNTAALSMKKAADIEQALSDGDYERALELDPNNTELPLATLRLSPITNSIGMELKLLPPGVFEMGYNDFKYSPKHWVTLSEPFMIGVSEVTQAQFELLMGKNPSKHIGVSHPVDSVTWHDAVAFCSRLSDLPAERSAGRVYRLPTEAEWEYACRAGTITEYSFGDHESQLGEYAWYAENSSGTTHPVCILKPNAWGLYDMHGNVYEWCHDWNGEYSQATSTQSVTNPHGPEDGRLRIQRGGCFNTVSDDGLSSGMRTGGRPEFTFGIEGFRVVCEYAAGRNLDLYDAEALAMKKLADVELALSNGDYTRALELDPKNAAVISKTAAIEQALSDGDYAAALRIDSSLARKEIFKKPPITNSIGMKLKLLPPGEFEIGSVSPKEYELQQRMVTLTEPFMLGLFEVTQEQYADVMGQNPSGFKSLDRPVETVSWFDAVMFCSKLSSLPSEKAAGRVYRLPTESEWEYACRAGKITAYSTGDDQASVAKYAWYDGNSNKRTQPVGRKLPNAWGFYDMHGNVWEWCSDWHSHLAVGENGSHRVTRGGSCFDEVDRVRLAGREGVRPTYRAGLVGIRVAVSLTGLSNHAEADKLDLQQALSDGDYAAALQLDPSNAEALSMKKEADVQQALASGDYAAALQLDPTNAKARAALLRSQPITNSIGMELKWLPPGVFQMGGTRKLEADRTHQVTLTKPFMLGTHEVTRAQYSKAAGGAGVTGVDYPVTYVSWDAAVEFCSRLSALPAEKAAGRFYRLPTEAEWEYACRAGTTTAYSFGDDATKLGRYAWYENNSNGEIHPVGRKLPNSWGLYDMHGNVAEWCQDKYGNYPYGSVTDPSGPRSGVQRVLRGGSYYGYYDAELSSDRRIWWSAVRDSRRPSNKMVYIGFRVVCVQSGK